MANDACVHAADLLEVLQMLSIGKGGANIVAVLRRDGDEIVVTFGGTESAMRFAGRWDDEVRVPGSFVLDLAKRPPAGDEVRLEVRRGRLYIGSTFVECVVQTAGEPPIVLPLDAELFEVLRLRARHTPQELERSGLLSRCNEAEAKALALMSTAAGRP